MSDFRSIAVLYIIITLTFTIKQALSPRDIRWISRGLSAGEARRSVPDMINPAAGGPLPQPDSRMRAHHLRAEGPKLAGLCV